MNMTLSEEIAENSPSPVRGRSPRKQIALYPKIHKKLAGIAKRNRRTIVDQIAFWVEMEESM